jgi:hypothetical protein
MNNDIDLKIGTRQTDCATFRYMSNRNLMALTRNHYSNPDLVWLVILYIERMGRYCTLYYGMIEHRDGTFMQLNLNISVRYVYQWFDRKKHHESPRISPVGLRTNKTRRQIKSLTLHTNVKIADDMNQINQRDDILMWTGSRICASAFFMTYVYARKNWNWF